MPESVVKITFRVKPEIRDSFNAMVLESGLPDRGALLTQLVLAHESGLLLMVNKATKECLIAAAEEKVTRLAARTARETTHYCLYEEGYRSSPYE